MAVSHQVPRGNQDRNYCHQKSFWLVFNVSLWFWFSFKLTWLSLMGVDICTDEKLPNLEVFSGSSMGVPRELQGNSPLRAY